MKGQPFVQRLGFALAGLRHALGEKSLRLQVLALAAVLIAMATLRAAPIWWAAILTTAALVLVAELFNTALEALADHLHPEHHPAIGVAKDVAAGAVLVASLASLGVATAWLWSLLV